MAKVNATGRTTGGARHVRHYEWMLACPAYRALSCQARSLLTELYRLHNGENNGYLFMGCRRAAELLNVGKNVPTKLFRELVDKGFVIVARDSNFDCKTKEARAWTLTEFGVNGQPPTKDFMRWRPDTKIQNTVPKSGTVSPQIRDRQSHTAPKPGTVSPQIRDRDRPNQPFHGPQIRDAVSIPGGTEEPAPVNGTDVDLLIERVSRVKGLSHLKMAPTAIVAAFSAAARKRLLKQLDAGELNDSELVRAAIFVANVAKVPR